MKTFIAILYLAFASVLLLGQTPSRDEANRLERLSKTFPPEMPAANNDRATVTPRRSYCVYPSPATTSLSIKPCPATVHKLQVIPPFENIVPKTKPATPPAHVR